MCFLTSVVEHSANGCEDSIAIIGYGETLSATTSFSNCSGSGSPGPVVVNTRRFIYLGNRLIVVDTSFTASKDTLFLEPGTLRINEIHRESPLIAELIIARYEYASDGTLRRCITFNGPTPVDTTSYSYVNGDMVMQVSSLGGSDTLRFSYYTDKKVPENGYATQSHLAYGNAYTVRNAHLRREDLNSDGTPLTTYSYESDSYGNITKVIRTDAANPSLSDSLTYSYVCAVE